MQAYYDELGEHVVTSVADWPATARARGKAPAKLRRRASVDATGSSVSPGATVISCMLKCVAVSGGFEWRSSLFEW